MKIHETSQTITHDRKVPRILRLERDRLERRIQRQELNAVVPPAVGGDRLLRVVLLDGEPAAVLLRAERRELHEHDPTLARARRPRAEQPPVAVRDQRLHRFGRSRGVEVVDGDVGGVLP